MLEMRQTTISCFCMSVRVFVRVFVGVCAAFFLHFKICDAMWKRSFETRYSDTATTVGQTHRQTAGSCVHVCVHLQQHIFSSSSSSLASHTNKHTHAQRFTYQQVEGWMEKEMWEFPNCSSMIPQPTEEGGKNRDRIVKYSLYYYTLSRYRHRHTHTCTFDPDSHFAPQKKRIISSFFYLLHCEGTRSISPNSCFCLRWQNLKKITVLGRLK